MSSQFSAKDEAHKIEALAKALISPYDATKGCTTTENQLVAELQTLQKNPVQTKAVQRRLLLDDLIPSDLPTLTLSHESNNRLQLNVYDGIGAGTEVATADTDGRIVSTNEFTVSPSSAKWVLDNFDNLDTNKDGKVSDLELQGKNPPSVDVYKIPSSAGSLMSSVTSESMGYGYRMSNVGSVGSYSYGFGLSSETKNIYGVTKSQLEHLQHQYESQHCDK